MKKIVVILKREYLTRVKTRGFVIGTLISPLLMSALFFLPGYFAARGSGGERTIYVLDQSGDPQLYDAIVGRASGEGLSRGEQRRNTKFNFHRVEVPADADLEEFRKPYNGRVADTPDTAYVVLPPDILDGGAPWYYARTTSDLSIDALQDMISDAVAERRWARDGIERRQIEANTRPVELKRASVTAEGEKEESGRPLFLVGIVMLFFIYMTILIYGITVMRGVIEEKQSRIIEVIVSSARPTQMMMGKLIGIGAVGLTQYLVWIAFAVLLWWAGASLISSSGIEIPEVPASLLVYFVIYFVLGYFLYATLYAMIGAIVSTEDEAQQVQLPVTMLIILPMLLFTMVMNNPNSGMAIGLSMVPFFAPTLMMVRIAVAQPPIWQILLSMALMVLAILGVVWVAAKIYRVGILMYGKRPSLAELGRWLRYS